MYSTGGLHVFLPCCVPLVSTATVWCAKQCEALLRNTSQRQCESANMASLLEKGSSLSSCASCSSPLSRPVLLECLHSACLPCLTLLVRDDACIVCPSCQLMTKLPVARVGVRSLPFNFVGSDQFIAAAATGSELICDECDDKLQTAATVRCLDCRQHLCETHGKAHDISKATRTHRTLQISATKAGGENADAYLTAILCALHSQELDLYCKTCKRSLCCRCSQLGNHSTHSVVSVEQARCDLASRVQRQVNNAQKEVLPKLEFSVQTAKKAIDSVNAETETASERINKIAEDLVIELRHEQQRLCGELDAARWRKLAALEQQAGELTKAKDSVERAVIYSKELKRLGAQEFAQVADWLLDLLTEGEKIVNNDSKMEPCEQADTLVFISNGDRVKKGLTGSFPLGIVHSVDAGRSQLHCKRSALARSEVTAQIVLCDDQSKVMPVSEIGCLIDAQVVDSSQKVVNHWTMAQQNHLDIIFEPIIAGIHQVSVKIGHRHIHGSPQAVTVQSREPHEFDVESCSEFLQVSPDKHSVTTKGRSGHGFVLGRKPLDVGEEWQLKVTVAYGSALSCGVSCKPPPEVCDCLPRLGAPGCALWLCDSGGAVCRMGAWGDRRELQKWQSGDILLFHLSQLRSLTVTHKHDGPPTTIKMGNIEGEVFIHMRLLNDAGVELL